uniref:ribosomal protein S8 n=1 Tax=Cyperus glomeratus TaxID=1249729 RepID=UPI001F144C99|nr:ribosomal protein S8 [Cyperus glomeratus]YP_010292648.1 ribosomal protein S8 [Cyperus michelianus]YP_010292739.1 ribosomal protein S8 [Cyperus simaoensis]YP_010985725.1 ribosomal protein S8 [Cyperus amuricus]ULQ64697.1 ribosomal protein S8 [Cyperus glomeratus]ULQ64841.1 ribosomal protein S8 [Cyperus michelianus]ULQ64932.1 ribosomal protein S8 [Cyperus simaoensis]WOL36643.1 ribosomal protein S8 [Cyperus amuricus]
MSKDTISDLITLIRNADMAKKETVQIPSTNITESIVKILLREGFIENVRKHKKNNKNFLILTLRYRKTRKGIYGHRTRTIFLKRISRPSLRIYSKYQRIPKILGGIGVVILSTSQGIMTDREARLQRIGGEILCYIW